MIEIIDKKMWFLIISILFFSIIGAYGKLIQIISVMIITVSAIICFLYVNKLSKEFKLQ